MSYMTKQQSYALRQKQCDGYSLTEYPFNTIFEGIWQRSTEDVSYSHNDNYLITFEKENDDYHYEANSSLYDIDETLLKDLITDLISKF